MSNNFENWEDCPVCDKSIKAKNFERHIKRVHPDEQDEYLDKASKKQSKNRNRAEIRKGLEQEKKKKDDIMFFSVVAIIVIAIFAGYYYFAFIDDSGSAEFEPAEEIIPATGSDEIRISVSEVSDGDAHHYKYDAGGTDIHYFVLKSSDGVIRAAFNACDVCYQEKLGYKQDGDDMVCNNCGQRFASNRINEEKGGCNPAPLDRTVDGSDLVIKIKDIEDGKKYF